VRAFDVGKYGNVGNNSIENNGDTTCLFLINTGMWRNPRQKYCENRRLVMKPSSDRLISRGKTIFGSRAIARIVRRVSRSLIATRHSAEKGGELLLLLRLVGTSTYVIPITVPTILTSKHRFVTVRLCTRYSVSAYLAFTVTATTTARRHPFAVCPR